MFASSSYWQVRLITLLYSNVMKFINISNLNIRSENIQNINLPWPDTIWTAVHIIFTGSDRETHYSDTHRAVATTSPPMLPTLQPGRFSLKSQSSSLGRGWGSANTTRRRSSCTNKHQTRPSSPGLCHCARLAGVRDSQQPKTIRRTAPRR